MSSSLSTTVPPILSVLSTQFIKVRVRATKYGSLPIDLTLFPVYIQIVTQNSDISDDGWLAASWESRGGNYRVTILIGPEGALTLPIGSYDIWVKIIGEPEIPVLKSGTFEIVDPLAT